MENSLRNYHLNTQSCRKNNRVHNVYLHCPLLRCKSVHIVHNCSWNNFFIHSRHRLPVSCFSMNSFDVASGWFCTSARVQRSFMSACHCEKLVRMSVLFHNPLADMRVWLVSAKLEQAYLVSAAVLCFHFMILFCNDRGGPISCYRWHFQRIMAVEHKVEWVHTQCSDLPSLNWRYSVNACRGWSQCPHQSHWLRSNPTSK